MIVSHGCGSAAYNETASRHHRLMKTMSKRSKRRNPHPCSLREAHLFGVSREYLGGGAAICESAKPARSLLAG